MTLSAGSKNDSKEEAPNDLSVQLVLTTPASCGQNAPEDGSNAPEAGSTDTTTTNAQPPNAVNTHQSSSDSSPSTTSTLRLAPSLPPEVTNPLTRSLTPKINSLATDLLRVLEPLQVSLGRLRHALPPEVEVNKLIQCFVLKLDPLMETLTSMVEETEKAIPAAGASTDTGPPPATSVTATSSLSAFFNEFRKVAHKKASPPAPALPKKPPPIASKKAPPPIKGKAPPPGKAGKKPPPKTGVSVPKLDLEDLSKADCDISLEQIPDPHLIPKAIQWPGIPSDKAVGTIWEDLLKVDRHSMTARDWTHRYLSLQSESPSQEGNVEATTTTGSHHISLITPPASVVPPFKFEVHYNLLNDLFFQNANEKKKEAEKPLSEALVASARTRNVSCLDPKRTHKIEISLKGCKLYDDFSPIYNTICELKFGEQEAHKSSSEGVDTNRKKELDPATVHFLLEVYPNPDEIKALKKLAANPPIDQRIAPADQFLLELLKIPRFHERADAVCTKMTFNVDILVVVDKISKLFKFCDLALHCVREGILKPVFALILKMGNYINCRTKRALVPGLQMSALENLRQIRSIDGSKSFMRVVADHIEEQFPLGWKQLEWLCLCSEAADINPDDSVQILNQLEARIKRIQVELDHPEVQKDQRFVECFKIFVENSTKRIQDLRLRVDEVKGKLMKLAEALADKAKTPKEALEIFKRLDKFGKDLFNCKKEIEAEKHAHCKRKMRHIVDRTPLSNKASAPVIRLKQQSKTNEALTVKPREQPSQQQPPHLPSASSTSELKPPTSLLDNTPRTPPRRDTAAVSPPPTARRPPLNDEFRDTPRILKQVVTADPCATPHSSRNYHDHAIIPKSPPAVTMLHGSRLSTKDLTRSSRQRRLMELSKTTPRHLFMESPRDEGMYDVRSTARNSQQHMTQDEEIVLEEDLGTEMSNTSRHKKSRSHAYHKSVKSLQNMLSPASKATDPEGDYYGHIMRDVRNVDVAPPRFHSRQQAADMSRRSLTKVPDMSSPLTYHHEPYMPPGATSKSSLYQHPELVLSGDSSCMDEEIVDLEFEPITNRRGMSRKLNRVAGDIGDEVMSLGSQSSMGSSNPMNRQGGLASHASIAQPLHDSPTIVRCRYPIDDGRSASNAQQSTYTNPPPAGRASPQSSRHSAQQQGPGLASIFSLMGVSQAAMMRSNLSTADYRHLAPMEGGPRLMPQGTARYPVTSSPPLLSLYSTTAQGAYGGTASGRVTTRLPEYPGNGTNSTTQQAYWASGRSARY